MTNSYNLIDQNIDRVKQSLSETNSKDATPREYISIAKKFQKVKDTNESVIVEEGTFPHTDSNVMYINYVSDRWVGGYSLLRYENSTVKVPRTIHYSDIFVRDKNHKIKIIFEGANPYEEEQR